MSQRRVSAEVYWRRRLLLLAAAIALVWVVLQVTGGDDEPRAKPTPPPSSSAAPTVAPTPSAKVNGIVDVSLASSPTACDPEKVRITPTVNPGQFARAAVAIGLVVSSTSTNACTLLPADADVVAVIAANGTPVWDSTVCQEPLLTAPVGISPGWASLVTVRWTGRGSGSNCSAKEGFATPGNYTVQIGTLGGEPGKVAFTLSPAPKPAPTKSTPTKSTPTKSTPSKTTPTPKPPKTTTRPAD